jgi:hypothetical protein
MGVVATMDAASQNATSKTVGSVSFCDGCVTKRLTWVVGGWAVISDDLVFYPEAIGDVGSVAGPVKKQAFLICGKGLLRGRVGLELRSATP